MQSFILVSNNPTKQEEYLQTLFAKEGIDTFDITVIEPEILKSEKEGSIGIKEVRVLQETIALMPRKGTYRAVVFKNADSLTIQAQNALLKTFEEPPPHTLIFILVDNEQQLLPTICSRCTIVKLDVILGTNEERTPESRNRSWTSQDDDQHAVSSLEKLTVERALLLAQENGKSQESALIFINSMILALREKLINNITASNAADAIEQYNNFSISLFLYFLVSLQKASVDIQTSNVNPRFALENHLLQITDSSFWGRTE